MPAIFQKGRRQSDEKATLIYYQKNKNKNKNTPLNFTAFRALRESQRMILNGGKKAYNVKLCPFPFWNYLPMIKKKKIRPRTPTSLECVTRGRRVHSIIAIPLSPGRTPKLSRASSLYT